MCGLEKSMGQGSGLTQREGYHGGGLCSARSLQTFHKFSQLMSCAVPQVLLHFWPSWQSLHHTQTCHRDDRQERGLLWRKSMLEQEWELLVRSAISLWPAHKPDPGALISTDRKALGDFGST